METEINNTPNKKNFNAWISLLIIVLLLIVLGIVWWTMGNNKNQGQIKQLDSKNNSSSDAKTNSVIDNTLTRDEIILLINQERTKIGLSSLQENSLLNEAAENIAKDMLSQNYFDRISPKGKKHHDFVKESGYNFCYLGENLALDHQNDLVEYWMLSEDTKNNIINPNFEHIGIVKKEGKFNGAATTFNVMLAGSLCKK